MKTFPASWDTVNSKENKIMTSLLKKYSRWVLRRFGRKYPFWMLPLSVALQVLGIVDIIKTMAISSQEHTGPELMESIFLVLMGAYGVLAHVLNEVVNK